MGYLRDIHSNLDPQTFPGAHFEIVGDVPAAQCSEARIEGDTGLNTKNGFTLTDIGAFAGYVLAGKVLTITAPPANAGNYDINNNTDNYLILNTPIPDASSLDIYYVHDSGSLILTRNASSFFRYVATYNILADFYECFIDADENWIVKVDAFTEDYSGLPVYLPGAGPPDKGPWTIIYNDTNRLYTDHIFGIFYPDIDARITRPDPAAATIKGGKLYTNIPSDQLKNACSILFDPLS